MWNNLTSNLNFAILKVLQKLNPDSIPLFGDKDKCEPPVSSWQQQRPCTNYAAAPSNYSELVLRWSNKLILVAELGCESLAHWDLTWFRFRALWEQGDVNTSKYLHEAMPICVIHN